MREQSYSLSLSGKTYHGKTTPHVVEWTLTFSTTTIYNEDNSVLRKQTKQKLSVKVVPLNCNASRMQSSEMTDTLSKVAQALRTEALPVRASLAGR